MSITSKRKYDQEAPPNYLCGKKDDSLNVIFPERIGSLNYQYKQQYDDPSSGYRLRYEDGQLFKVDIYIYDKGLSDIGTGINGTQVKKEFEELVQVFPLMEEMGKYKDVKQLEKGIFTDEDDTLGFLWSRCQYRQSPNENVSYVGLRISETYLTAICGQLVKVRLTLKHKDYVDRKDDVGIFIAQLSKILISQLVL